MSRRLLAADELARLSRSLPGWSVVDGRLCREFTFADFAGAFAFMTAAAEVAEELDHHPDWSNSWNRVEVSLTTHSAGGVTGLDVALAEAMNALAP